MSYNKHRDGMYGNIFTDPIEENTQARAISPYIEPTIELVSVPSLSTVTRASRSSTRGFSYATIVTPNADYQKAMLLKQTADALLVGAGVVAGVTAGIYSRRPNPTGILVGAKTGAALGYNVGQYLWGVIHG